MNTKLSCLVAVSFLSACTSSIAPPTQKANTAVTPPPSIVKETSNTRNASKMVSWELSGALAAKGNKKAFSASLNWVQQGPNKYQIRLFGPLGGGTVIIEKTGSIVTYRDGPKTASSKSADILLQQQTGIRLPVNNLYYWVRGLPAPGAVQDDKRDEAGHLTDLKQAGYAIQYANYISNLPRKIHLQGQGVTVKLVIKHWKALE